MLIAARYILHTLSIDSIALLNFMLIQLQQYYIHVYIYLHVLTCRSCICYRIVLIIEVNLRPMYLSF